MKHCNSCNASKEGDKFHKRAASLDGLAARCKECQSTYDKARAQNPKRVDARRAYAETEDGKEAGRRGGRAWAARNKGLVLEITQKYRRDNPNKARAHGLVGYAIKRGNLHSEPCEVCQSTDLVHAHHDDYAKPLNVRWLCPQHHRDWHKEHGEALNP